MFMKKYFDKKREDIENVLKMDGIPQVQYYDQIAKIKSEQFKMERNEKNKKINEVQRYELLSEKEKTNLDIDKSICLLNDYEKGLYEDEGVNNNNTINK